MVSSRELDFVLKPTAHDVITLTFEYGFMLSSRITIHGAITSIYQVYTSVPTTKLYIHLAILARIYGVERDRWCYATAKFT